MIPLEKIIKLLESLESNSQSQFESVLKDLVALSEKRGHTEVAKRLRHFKSHTALHGHKDIVRPSGIYPTTTTEGVFEWRNSVVSKKDIVLPPNQIKIFEEIKLAYEKAEMLKKHGLNNEIKVLLFGPPGTGKTLFVYALAGELGIPVMHIYIDSLVSSYLGETGKNIKKIFENAGSRPCILFLDEFDAIAKQRDDNHELGELKRVVTVLLQNIDDFSSGSILVSATNHEHLLDKAIWRRFNYNLSFDLPSDISLRQLYALLLKDDKSIDYKMLAGLSAGISGAGVRHVIESAMKKKLLENSPVKLETIIVEEILQSYAMRRIDMAKKKDRSGLIKAIAILRKVNPKRYTFAYLEEMTGIPDATLHSLTKHI